MIIEQDTTFFRCVFPKRILALDVSKKRIGIAISSNNLTLALPVKTINRNKFLPDVNIIGRTYQEYDCGGIVIGYPVNLDGSLGPRCQSIRSFAKKLLEHLDTPMFLENEQFSTYAIKELYKDARIKLKHPLDANAAAYFLQNFLDRVNRKTTL